MEYNLYITLNSKGEHIHVNNDQILQQFARITSGHFVVMSEVRYRFMPSGYLGNKTTFIVGRVYSELSPFLYKVKSAKQAFKIIGEIKEPDQQIFLIGGNPNGKSINKMYIVRVNTNQPGKPYPSLIGKWKQIYFEDFDFYNFEVIENENKSYDIIPGP